MPAGPQGLPGQTGWWTRGSELAPQEGRASERSDKRPRQTLPWWGLVCPVCSMRELGAAGPGGLPAQFFLILIVCY